MVKDKTTSFNLILFLSLGCIVVLGTTILSVFLGSIELPFHEVSNALFQFDPNNVNHQIIRTLRIPRTLADMAIGAAFAVSGAIMQGMTRNPIADSGILGINYGASFALSLCLALGVSINYSVVVLFSLLGAGFATCVVYGLTGINHGKQSPVRLVLAGTATGLFLSSLSQAIALHFGVAQEVTFWTVGGVAGISMVQIASTAPFIIAALIGSLVLSRSLSLLSIGEASAKGLGLNIGRTKTLCMILVLVLAGSAVAMAGPVSFVGLIIPHIVRAFVGVDYRKIIPGCIIWGAAAVLMADLASRLINPPHETPLGLIFAIVGVPFFLYLSRRKGGEKVA